MTPEAVSRPLKTIILPLISASFFSFAGAPKGFEEPQAKYWCFLRPGWLRPLQSLRRRLESQGFLQGVLDDGVGSKSTRFRKRIFLSASSTTPWKLCFSRPFSSTASPARGSESSCASTATETLAVVDSKLGNAIKEKLKIYCHHTNAVMELMRRLRRAYFWSAVQDLAPMSSNLSHSFSRYMLKFSPDKAAVQN